ncbi:17171_t:CDS:1, partial [Racocetra persica]
DQVVLKALEYSVNGQSFHVDFSKEKENHLAINSKAIDQGKSHKMLIKILQQLIFIYLKNMQYQKQE